MKISSFDVEDSVDTWADTYHTNMLRALQEEIDKEIIDDLTRVAKEYEETRRKNRETALHGSNDEAGLGEILDIV